MALTDKDVDVLLGNILDGLKPAKNFVPKRIILQVGELSDLIDSGHAISALADKLDDLFPRSEVIIENPNNYKRLEGDYHIDLGAYKHGTFWIHPENASPKAS